MSAFYDLNKTPRNILNQAIVRAIVSENNGAWFYPSDMSTLYQDVAGTTPVTAVEQPVGKMLDKSGNGYHATQSVTASRPTLSARKNVLLATEALATQSVTTLAAQYTLSFTGTGSVTLSGTTTGTLTGTGPDRVSLTVTPTAGTLTLTVSGSVTKAQLELGAVAGPYQRVNTATDYDTDERYFPKYLRFDGIDDYLNLPYMGLYANGSASVVMAKDESSNEPANRLYVSEASLSNSAFYSPVRVLGGVGIGGGSISDNGTVNFAFTTPLVNARACIETAIDSGTLYTFFRDGSVKGSTPKSSSLTTTLGNTTIGIRRAGGGFDGFCKMNLYSLIITKSALTDAQRIKCERYAASKAGVIL